MSLVISFTLPILSSEDILEISVGDSSAEWNQRRECCVWARIPGSQVWISQRNQIEAPRGVDDGQGKPGRAAVHGGCKERIGHNGDTELN